ncbi:hypothetical protein ASPZODRAFT_136137 [Penicilliopsis zonata CBS 506.65]|uniref:Major facilitator superfamily (MFS) profile domain-containing protein n=1 Tax=Penicilliopsis zonata CBS 506.65 TaxID=1073090 RepID=A0A1L9S943_9EURO|nr:hypothetical protein ASPZODRAFT_136137 [Penicilliopsis zonata CBS 506.65]OJJ43677.1 hypothetical protein ASPZODRAFT_136137 [Penicilliopsis zonata CBS 506.65]
MELDKRHSKIQFLDMDNITKDEDSVRGNPKLWSPWKKNLLFMALMSSSLLADGAMTWGATLITYQAEEWDISVSHSATSMNYGILLQGFGGIFAVPFIEAYGRLPVWLWPQIITMFMVLGATLSNSWGVFTTFRSLQGLFGTIPQVIGLPIIHDMYDAKDWPRMINIWGTTFLVGPFLGPAIAGYILEASSWKISFAVLTALYAFSTILIVVFGYETYYIWGQRLPATSRAGAFFGIGNTHQLKRATLLKWCRTLAVYIFKLPLLLTGIAVMVVFTWPIGITTTIDTFLYEPPYLFDAIQASSMRFAGALGGLLGFVFGFLFNKWIFKFHRNSWRSEYRLHGVWAPLFFMAAGLVTYGLTLHSGALWVGLAFGWMMVNIGMVAITVAITAYALEKYPSHATCVAAILNMWRTCGGFSVSYYQPAWIVRNGTAAVFGTQAAVVVAAVILTVTMVIILEGRKHTQQEEEL